MIAASPPTRLSIRRMRAEDLLPVHAIEEQSFPTPWPLRSYRFELQENPAARLWVAEAEDTEGERQVVGMAVVWLLVDEAHIANIAVHPAHRRQGIGCRLLRTALQACSQEGAQLATLEVRAGNRAAQALYRKFGFEVLGRRRRYYHDTGEDALIMGVRHLSASPLAEMRCPEE